MRTVIFQVIFWSAIVFLGVCLWTITIGQVIPYEFRDSEVSSTFYNMVLGGAPIAIVLTLFGTMKKHHDTIKKITTIALTLVVSILSFLGLVNSMFTLGFGAWTTSNIAYEHKTNPERQIREQRFDVGALGYGGKRVVELKPFAGLFWKTNLVDTAAIDKSVWIRVDKAGDIKFP